MYNLHTHTYIGVAKGEWQRTVFENMLPPPELPALLNMEPPWYVTGGRGDHDRGGNDQYEEAKKHDFENAE